jgi:hypothetical protein
MQVDDWTGPFGAVDVGGVLGKLLRVVLARPDLCKMRPYHAIGIRRLQSNRRSKILDGRVVLARINRARPRLK